MKDFLKIQIQEITEQIDAQYKYREEKEKWINGVVYLVSAHYITTEYKNHTIFLEYELGKYNMGYVKMELERDHIMIPFQFKKVSHLRRLFNSKMNSLQVVCKNKIFKKEIERLLIESHLEQIARDTLFEPQIEIQQKKGGYEMITKFYLGFDDKEHSIIPMIDFYKGIIDYFARN